MIASVVFLIVARFVICCATRLQRTPWLGNLDTPMSPPPLMHQNHAIFSGRSASAAEPESTRKRALVSKMKRLQRSNEDQKQAWSSFCDSQPGKRRDPAQYQANVLEAFLAGQGIRFTVSFAKGELINKIKALQRSSQELKLAWWAFCDSQPDQKRDPAEYEEDVLHSFLAQHGILFAPGTMEQKNMLVTKIKDFQKSGEKQMEQWLAYCATQMDQSRDPALHEVGVLAAFVHAVGI